MSPTEITEFKAQFMTDIPNANPDMRSETLMEAPDRQVSARDLFGRQALEPSHADRFEDPNLPGTLQVTVRLKPVTCGTELSITQAGIPEVIPLEMCYVGWQESLAQLAALVEPDIPG